MDLQKHYAFCSDNTNDKLCTQNAPYMNKVKKQYNIYKIY